MTRRSRIFALVLAGGMAAGLIAWRWRGGRPLDDATFETAEVDRGSVVAKVTATGTVSAIVTVQVGSQVSGRISALHADFNSNVTRGQVIARIDPQLFEAAVEQARASHVAAQGNLARSKAQALDAARQRARSRTLFDRKLIAQADDDTAEANADAADAQVKASEGAVEQARAALHQAEVNLAYTRIVSPTSGIVISRNVDVGQTVAASLQAPTLFTIAEDLAKMQVDTSVGEADVGRLRAGMPATFTVDAYPGEVFQGTVRQIRNAPTTVQNVVTYDAVVDVANPELKLKPGMTANVTFVHARRDDVLRVANAALRFRPPQGSAAFQGRVADAPGGGPRHGAGSAPAQGVRTVWALRGGQPVPISIRPGVSDGSMTEVVEGDLRAGDHVVTDAGGATSIASAASQRRAMGPPPP